MITFSSIPSRHDHHLPLLLPGEEGGGAAVMRKLCPNYEREDALDTVLEVPIPEEVFAASACPSKPNKKLNYTMTLSRFARTASAPAAGKSTELQLLLVVLGAPLVPLPVSPPCHSINYSLKQEPIEMSSARYIVRQYVAATGGERALQAAGSMYAMGKVRMTASDYPPGYGAGGKRLSKSTNGFKWGDGGGEMGGFVFWQKKPDLWCLELVVSGCKISAGSDGKVAWRQTPWHPPHASRGPPRPLRRALQGLDPLSTSNLFSFATCIGEKTVNGDGCYVLRLDADAFTLRSRNTTNIDVLRHNVWGSFSHRTGLLVHLEDSHLLRVKSVPSGSNPSSPDHSVYWETTMESFLDDYRAVDGVLIAHSGRTLVSLFRFRDSPETHTKTRMEETWSIEEVEFNVRGLQRDCFLPPSDMRKESVEGHEMLVRMHPQRPYQIHTGGTKCGQSLLGNGGTGSVRWMASSRVAAVEDWIESCTFTPGEVVVEDDHDDNGDDEEDEMISRAPYQAQRLPLQDGMNL